MFRRIINFVIKISRCKEIKWQWQFMAEEKLTQTTKVNYYWTWTDDQGLILFYYIKAYNFIFHSFAVDLHFTVDMLNVMDLSFIFLARCNAQGKIFNFFEKFLKLTFGGLCGQVCSHFLPTYHAQTIYQSQVGVKSAGMGFFMNIQNRIVSNLNSQHYKAPCLKNNQRQAKLHPKIK